LNDAGLNQITGGSYYCINIHVDISTIYLLFPSIAITLSVSQKETIEEAVSFKE
jgi:hypothetical protein